MTLQKEFNIHKWQSVITFIFLVTRDETLSEWQTVIKMLHQDIQLNPIMLGWPVVHIIYIKSWLSLFRSHNGSDNLIEIERVRDRERNNYLLTGKKVSLFTEMNSRYLNVWEFIEVTKVTRFTGSYLIFFPKQKIYRQLSNILSGKKSSTLFSAT